MKAVTGVGARIFDFEDDRNDEDTAFGIRIPGGIMFDFERVPLDIFIEGAAILDFFREGGSGPGANFMSGARYYF